VRPLLREVRVGRRDADGCLDGHAVVARDLRCCLQSLRDGRRGEPPRTPGRPSASRTMADTRPRGRRRRSAAWRRELRGGGRREVSRRGGRQVRWGRGGRCLRAKAAPVTTAVRGGRRPAPRCRGGRGFIEGISARRVPSRAPGGGGACRSIGIRSSASVRPDRGLAPRGGAARRRTAMDHERTGRREGEP
jgi:hypothetical protein